MPRLLIHSTVITSRLRYVSHLLFRDLMGLEIAFTKNPEEFTSASDLKLNYSHQSLDCDLHIKPAKLLFEKRISDQEFSLRQGDIPLLFANDTELGFDPLAASFYIVSRYEEYLPHRTDEHGRYPARESYAAKHNFLDVPLVEHYAKLLARHLGIEWSSTPELEVTFDIDQAFAFKHKGWLRSALGFGKQISRFDLQGANRRYRTLMDTERDPLDIYGRLMEMTTGLQNDPVFFLQVGENSAYDINGPSYHAGFQELALSLEQEASVGVHPSYYSSTDEARLQKEVTRLRKTTTHGLRRSRQHYIRFQWPSTFVKLEEAGITDEYSMGFPEANGFRAGISRPYRFYNLVRDEVSNLTIHPFAFMDMASMREANSHEEIVEAALNMWERVKEVGGKMSTVWHLEALTGYGTKLVSMPALKALLSAR